jgi:AcrR family transcriptional regulator
MMELRATDTEQRILEKARELFFHFGIKSVSMDDIAKDLGISKKTLYTHYKDKNEIVKIVMEGLLAKHGRELLAATSKAENAIEEVFLQNSVLLNVFKDVKPNLLFEIDKYFPEVSGQVNEHRSNCILEGIKENLKRGLEEEVYIKDLAIDFTAQIRLNQLLDAFDPKAYSETLSFPDALHQLTLFYLNAITTSESKKLIATYLKQHI